MIGSPARRLLRRIAPLVVFGGVLVLVGTACGGVSDATFDASATPSIGKAATAAPGKDGRMVTDGDNVRVHYRGTLDDGTEFDSSKNREPLAFKVGTGQVISGFDEAVRGLEVGQSRTVRMEAKDAYGEVRPDLIVQVPLPQGQSYKAGDRVRLGNGQPATVKEVTAETVTVDTNHALAGKALTFDVELVAID